jgi:uncharacterized protein
MSFSIDDFTYFDAHVHLYPERLFKAVRDWFAVHSDWKLLYGTDIDEIVGFLTRARVKRFFFFNYAHKPNMSAQLNRWNYEVMARYPQSVALGTVHAGDDDPAQIARQCLEEFGFPGFKIHIEVQRFAPADERLFPVYEQLMELNGFIVMHVGTAPWANEFCGAVRFAELMRRFPRLKVIVAHMGLYETARFFELMEEYTEVRLDTTMAFGPMSPFRQDYDPEQIERFHKRILYGSDFPNIPYDYSEDRRGLLGLDLSREAYEHIFYLNAEGLLDEASVKRKVL